MINNNLEKNQILENLIKDCNAYMRNINTLNETESHKLNEGLWEKIKYGLSKLGRYKADGKIFGKSKVDAKAAAQIKTILDKKGNEVIKALDSKIKETNPEFPNNKEGEKFLQTILEISALYDSIVAATQKSPEDQGFLPVDAANAVIEDLAVYVKKFLDVDLAAVYSTMDESIEEADDQAAQVRTQLQAKAGTTTRDSERMKTLASNKLPLVLGGIGAALGALGWLAQTDWLKNVILDIFGRGTPGTEAITKTIDGGAADSKGFINWISRIEGKPMSTGADVQEFVNKYGIENVQQMFQGNGGGTVEEQGQKLLQLIGGENSGKSVGELFREQTFGDMKLGRNLFGISKVGRFVATTIIKEATKATVGAGAGIAASVAGIGSVLVPLGIALISAGALVKLMRMKGQKQSRAKTLNDLLQSLQPLEGNQDNPPVVIDINITINMLYRRLYSFFIFIKNYVVVIPKPTPVPVPPPPIPKPIREPSFGYEYVPPADRRDYPSETIPTSLSGWSPTIAESEEDMLSEGRYINNRKTLTMINNQMGAENVKKFENFLSRIEKMINTVKNIKPYGIKSVDAEIERLRANPIMQTDLTQLFASLENNPNQVKIIQSFITGILKTLSSGRYTVADIKEAIGDSGQEQPNPVSPPSADADLKTFKKNLFAFIGGLIKVYNQVKMVKKTKTSKPESPEPTQQQLAEFYNKLIHLSNYKRNL